MNLLSRSIHLSELDERLKEEMAREIKYSLFSATTEVKRKKAKILNAGPGEGDQEEMPVVLE